MGIFTQSELNLQNGQTCLLQIATSDFISQKLKDSSAYTLPVCRIAEGECTSQKPQIEDSLWEI